MKNKDQILLESIYERTIINEISKKYVDEVKDAVKGNELPFNNIFGNKLRIIIPVKGTKTYVEILDAVSKIKNYSGFDPQKKEVIKTIKLDPKYGGGEKEQRINLGKAISSLSIPEEQKKKFLNWFASYNSNIPEMDDLKKYSIIISRSPIDVLRMSDIGDLDSCHAEGGSYFQCAIQEAKKGGPIAYLVKTNDIMGMSDEEFQNEEIFKDSSRDVSGITALARLRIRKYVNKDTEEELAVPETRIYGDKVSGFYDTIKDFIKDKQPDLDTETVIKQFKDKKFLRTGGTYTDSGDDLLFNRMFDTDTMYGSVSHRGEDEDEEDGDDARAFQFEEELRGFDNRYNNFKHFSTGRSVEWGDEPGNVYYNAWCLVAFEMDENIEFTDDYYDIEIDDNDSVRSIKRYNPKGHYQWERSLPYSVKGKEDLAFKLQKFFKSFDSYDSSSFSDAFNRFKIDSSGDILMEVGFGDDNCGYSYDTDDYRRYLEDIEEYDDKYEEIKKAIVKSLYAAGFIQNSDEHKNIKDNKFETEEDLGEVLKNFKYETSTDTFDLRSKSLMLLPDEELDKNKHIDNNLEKEFSRFLEKFLEKYFKPEQAENKDQMTFKSFFESYQTPILKKYGVSFEFSMTQQQDYSKNKKSMLNGNLYIKISYLNNLTSQLIQFLDNNVEDLINVMRLLALKRFGLDNEYKQNLEKVYGNLLT